MFVYFLRADANQSKNLIPEDETVWQHQFALFNGNSFPGKWKSIKVKLLSDQKSGNLLSGDFPSFASHVPVFSKRTVLAINDLLRSRGELYPLICDEGDYYAFNVTNVVDALDLEDSEIKYFRDGRIMRILHHKFRTEKLIGQHIFKIPQTPLMDVFVTQDFVSRVENANLLGFKFLPVS